VEGSVGSICARKPHEATWLAIAAMPEVDNDCLLAMLIALAWQPCPHVSHALTHFAVLHQRPGHNTLATIALPLVTLVVRPSHLSIEQFQPEFRWVTELRATQW